MSRVEGQSLDTLEAAPQAERDRVAHLLFELLFNEIFAFRHVQTDPNLANYLYDPASRRLVLLDFGATRRFDAALVEAYRRLLGAGMAGDRAGLDAAATEIGYFGAEIEDRHRRLVLDIFVQACEPLRHEGLYDFGRSSLAQRMRDAGMQLGTDRDFWHTPPVDALFLHRKIGGLYLLAARLGARVDIRGLFLRHAAGSPG
jgi:predicted unusual protein kinase regulating ubiquinone biosynthesis (AarF/ABC1/UbiB family)